MSEKGADWQRARLLEGAIPIGERMPPVRQSVLAWVSDESVSIHHVPVIAWLDGVNVWWSGLPGRYTDLSYHRWTVTHWMPLTAAAILALSPGDGLPPTERAAAGLSDAIIDGKNIVIRVPISMLPVAFTYWPDAPRDGEGDPLYRVSDPAEFARSIVRRLNDEEEDGTTRIHRMLDDAMNEALEQGDEGIEEVLPSPPTEQKD